MSKSNVTTNEQAGCLRILKAATEPMTAADIAVRMGLGGCRETQRRHVRAIVKGLRDLGSMIVATLQGGYWLTKDAAMYKDYLEFRQIDAKRILGESHNRKKKLVDSKGQGMLFEPTRIRVGVASVAVM